MIGTAWDWLTGNGVGQNILASVIWGPVVVGANHLLGIARHNKLLRQLTNHRRHHSDEEQDQTG